MNISLLENCIESIVPHILSQSNGMLPITIINGEFHFDLTINQLKKAHLNLLDNLTKIFDKNIKITFSANKPIYKKTLEDFASKYGDLVDSLTLSTLTNIKTLLPSCKNVKNLRLKNHFIRSKDLLPIQQMDQLILLDISDNKYIKKIPDLNHLKNLKSLSLSFVRVLKSIPKLPCLTKLNIERCWDLNVNDFNISLLSLITKENFPTFNLNNFIYINYDRNRKKNMEEGHPASNLFKTIKAYDLFFLLEKHFPNKKNFFYYSLFKSGHNTFEIINQIIIDIDDIFKDKARFFIKEIYKKYMMNSNCYNFKKIIEEQNLIEFIKEKLQAPTIEAFKFACNYELEIPNHFDISNFFDFNLVSQNNHLTDAINAIEFTANMSNFKQQASDILRSEKGISFITHPQVRDLLPSKKNFFELISTVYPYKDPENHRFYPILYEETFDNYQTQVLLSFKLFFSHIHKEPFYVLSKFLEAFYSFPNHFLLVHFLDNPGIDQGGQGINRQFFHLLLKKISEYYSLHSTIPQFSLNQETHLKNLGELFHYLVNQSFSIIDNSIEKRIPYYPVGQLFKDHFFTNLYSFSRAELSLPFSHISQERIFEICNYVFKDDHQLFWLNQLLNDHDNSNDDFLVGHINDLLVADVISSPLEIEGVMLTKELFYKYKNYFQKTIKTEYINTHKGALLTLFTILKGYYQYRFDDQFHFMLNSNQLKELIEGESFFRETLKNKMEYQGISSSIKEYFENFLENSDEATIKHFLTYVTGSPTIPYHNIKIINSNLEDGSIRVQTCFNKVDIAKNLTAEDIARNIGFWIEEVKNKS